MAVEPSPRAEASGPAAVAVEPPPCVEATVPSVSPAPEAPAAQQRPLAPPRPAWSPTAAELKARPGLVRALRPRRTDARTGAGSDTVRSVPATRGHVVEAPRPLPVDVGDVLALLLSPDDSASGALPKGSERARPEAFRVADSLPLPEEAAENLARCLGSGGALAPPAQRARHAPGGVPMEPSPLPPGVVPRLPEPADDVVMLAPARGRSESVPSDGAAHDAQAEGSESVPSDGAVSDVPSIDRISSASEPAVLASASEDDAPSDPTSGSNAFDAFVAALVDTALSYGATRAAALIPALLTIGRADRVDAASSVAAALTSAGLAEHSAGSLIATPELERPARAWRGVLLGQSEDFSACGDSTLDEWAARVLEGFGVESEGRGFKRELRARGIAAFGMLDAA